MKLSRTSNRRGASRPKVAPALAAFTLAEVLAALVFMAIVIPVAVEALHLASLSGEVAERKVSAARVADRILNENIVTTNWDQSQSGDVTEGVNDFHWTLRNENWTEDQMRLLTVDVTYDAQGKNYSVSLSTLVDAGGAYSQTSTLQQ